MRRSTRTTLLALLLAAPIAVQAQDGAPEVPDFSGDWVIDVDQSETMGEKMRDAMLNENSNPRAQARWGRYTDRSRGRMLSAGFSRLTIEQEEDRIRIRYHGGRDRTLLTNGPESEPETAYNIDKVEARWEGAKLAVDMESAGGGSSELWELSVDGQTLFVTTHVEGGERLPGGITFQRVYYSDLQPTSAPQADPEENDGND